MYVISLLIYIVLYKVGLVTTQDSCNNYNVFNDYKRSATYERTGVGASISLCDNLLTTGWYRSISPSGPLMPNACPALYRCGSDGSIWMDLAEADMPTSNNTKTAQACLADLLDCCSKTYSIDIKNCNDEYYIYKLIPTSGCPEAYCFGTEIPCPPGQFSENGYTPGCGEYPADNITGTVTPALIQVTETTGRGATFEFDRLTFECKFTIPNTGTDYVYDVHWYINNKDIPIKSFTKVEPGNIGTTLLLEEHWKNKHKMNMVVICATRIRYNATSSPSPYYWSHEFEAGLKTVQQEYVVKETETISIPLYLTVPLSCYKPVNGQYPYQKCILNIMTLIPTYQQNPDAHCGGTQVSEDGLVFKDQQCGIYITANNWTATRHLEVTGDIDNLYNSNKRIAYIRVVTQHQISDIWENITFPDIKVNIIDVEYQGSYKQCRSANDPHIYPFDDLAYPGYYDHFIPGEYVMYKHDVFPIQINAMFRKCNFGATCNCGVAIRNADALFVLNMCPSNLTEEAGWYGATKMNRYVEKNFCDDTNMAFTRSGDEYKIHLPSGTKVIIKAGRAFIDSFIIKASVLDIGHLSGLCGPYERRTFRYILSDKTESTDLQVFNRHYNVPKEKSLFALNWTADSNSLVNLQQYCVCRINGTPGTYPVDSPHILCNLTYPVQKCTELSGSRDTFYTQCSNERKRRSIGYRNNVYSRRDYTHHRYKREVDIEDGSIERYDIEPYDISTYVEETITWKNGWTESKAYAHCEQRFNESSAYAKCTELVPGIDVTTFIHSCMTDIKIGGDDIWLKDSLNAYKTACTVEAVMMEPLREKNTSSYGNKTFLDEILEASCVNDCSGHGQCIQGECRCDVGYIQEDCSKEANSVPDVAKNSVSGHCDTKHRACNKLLIPGYGFNPDGIKCALRKIQVTENGSVVETNKMIMEGEYVNQFSCQCSLPSRKKRSTSSGEIVATGYMISVANGNGTGNYSDEITFLIYNSDCYECDISSVTCVKKSDCPTTTIMPSQSTLPIQANSTLSQTPQTSPSSSVADPCSTYANLTGDVTRSVAWVLKAGDTIKCDAAITEQWYRIISDAGNDMVTSCPPTDRCGTHNPIWLNGSLSSYADGIVERDVCVSDIYDCCSYSWKIKLRNCGPYMLYYLPQSASCPQAYCFGTLYITTTSTPTTTTTTTTLPPTTTSVHKGNENNKSAPELDKDGLDALPIVGAVIGTVVFLTIIGVVTKITISLKHKASRKHSIQNSSIDLHRESTSGSFNNFRPSSAASAKSIDVLFTTSHSTNTAPSSTNFKK